MKKLKHVVVVLMMCFTCIATLVGCSCGKAKIESMKVKSGLNYTYLQNDEVSFDDIKVEVNYDDGTSKVVGKSDLTIGTFDTSVLGTFDVKIGYEDFEITVKLKVTNNKDEVYAIMGVENNKTMLQYNNALKDPTSGTDLEGVFANREANEDNCYKVGDDNPFVYEMNLTALDEDGNYVEGLKSTKTVTNVYLKDTYASTEYTKLNDNQISTYVEIDDENSSYDFTENAIGKFFKLEVRPYYLSEVQLLEVNKFTQTIEFKVVDGYNITDAKELGILYNVSELSEFTYENNTKDPVNLYNEWTEFLTDNGISRNDNVKAIILHNDITITGADIPSVYLATPANLSTPLYTIVEESTNEEALYNGKVLEDNLEGTVCYNSNIYCHRVSENVPFNFYGNFFTLKAKLPTVDTDILSKYGSTTSLFRFVSTYSSIENATTTLNNNAAAVASSEASVVNIYNLNSIGNATRTDSTNQDLNADSARMGGLIFVKAPAVTLNVKNSIIKSYLINFYAEERLSTMNLEDVKSYDAYQSIIYSKNGGYINIKTSELKRAGGPVILLANDDNELETKIATFVDIDRTSTLESLITGLEPWFKVYGQTDKAAYLKTNAKTFEDYFDSTFIKSGTDVSTQLVNAIVFNISNDDDNHSCSQSIAKVTIDGTVFMDTTGMNESTISGNKEFINNHALDGDPVFESANGALVSASQDNNASNFYQSGDNPDMVQYRWMQAMKADSSVDEDYVAIYIEGMSMVVGYYTTVSSAQ